MVGESMRAVILAAGAGSRLDFITRKKPKGMVTIGGRPILGHQIQAYIKAGIRDIIIVAGYKSDIIKEYCQRNKTANIKIIENKDYESTNNMYSLYLAKEEVAGRDFLLSNGDVVADPRIIYELVLSEISDAIACDKASYNKESMKITLDASGYIDDISKEIVSSTAYGNSIDIYKLSATSSTRLFEEISRIIEVENNVKDWVEVALQRLLRDGRLKMRPFDIEGKHWVEIDDRKDLSLADKLFSSIGPLSSKRLFFIDLDGTTYLGNKAINGAREFIARLKAAGKYVHFLSNNSSKSKEEYVIKLKSMGIETSADEIVLSTDGVIHFLKEAGTKDIFIVGTDSMKQAFKAAGFNNIESNNPEYVVLGYDTELTYSKLRQAALLLQKGVDLIATHCDIVCPTPEGPVPDIGSMLALFKAATGKTPIKIFGKPNPEMISHVIERHRLTTEDVVIIGDRLYTDMEMARRTGCSFICVLSGETNREHIEEVKHQPPSLIVENIGELTRLLE